MSAYGRIMVAHPMILNVFSRSAFILNTCMLSSLSYSPIFSGMRITLSQMFYR